MKKVMRHLDEVVVPRLAGGMARIAGWGPSGRWRLRILTALALTGSAAVLVTVVWASHSTAPEGRQPVDRPVVHVGVAQGQSIPTYLASSRSELKAMLTGGDPEAPAETYALVSLRTYLAADRLTPVLGGVSVAEVYTRVPLVQGQTQIVKIPAFRLPDDVFTGMRQVAARKDTEANEFQGLAAKLSEAIEAEGRLRQTYLMGAAIAAAEAAAYRGGCSCVYAAVVRATPAALDQIAARPEVRAVDPAPEVRRLDQAVFLAPLPEQQDIAAASPSPPPASPSASPVVKPTPLGVIPSDTPQASVSPMPSIEPRR